MLTHYRWWPLSRALRPRISVIRDDPDAPNIRQARKPRHTQLEGENRLEFTQRQRFIGGVDTRVSSRIATLL